MGIDPNIGISVKANASLLARTFSPIKQGKLHHRNWAAVRQPLWHLTVILLLQTGCTIFQPIQTPSDDRRFTAKPINGNAIKSVSCVDPGVHGVTCNMSENDLNIFYGDLAGTMWEMDERRRQLIVQAAEHTNLNSTYNALLWPLSAFFVAKKLREPQWSLRDVAAAGIGSFGLLSSGIPERDQLYLRTASQMACTLLIADAALYKQSEIKRSETDKNIEKLGGPWCEAVHTESTADPLETVIAKLRVHSGDYRQRLEVLLPTLAARGERISSSTISPDESNAERRLREAQGRSIGAEGNTSGAAQTLLPNLRAYLRGQLAQADALQRELSLQHDILRDAGAMLRGQRTFLETALARALNSRTPELLQPQEVAQRVMQLMAQERVGKNEVAKAQSGHEPDFLEEAPTAQQLASLSTASRKAVISLLQCQGTAMKDAMIEAQLWKRRHEHRLQQARQNAMQMGCLDSSLVSFANSLDAKPPIYMHPGDAAGTMPQSIVIPLPR